MNCVLPRQAKVYTALNCHNERMAKDSEARAEEKGEGESWGFVKVARTESWRDRRWCWRIWVYYEWSPIQLHMLMISFRLFPRDGCLHLRPIRQCDPMHPRLPPAMTAIAKPSPSPYVSDQDPQILSTDPGKAKQPTNGERCVQTRTPNFRRQLPYR